MVELNERVSVEKIGDIIESYLVGKKISAIFFYRVGGEEMGENMFIAFDTDDVMIMPIAKTCKVQLTDKKTAIEDILEFVGEENKRKNNRINELLRAKEVIENGMDRG